MRYAELTVTSNFTFLTGASHPDEFVLQAAELGHHAVALTDTNSLAGVVRAHVAAKEAGISFLVGCRLAFIQPEWLPLFVYPTDRTSYGRLCRLLTAGRRSAPKGECYLGIEDLLMHQEGLLGVVLVKGNLSEEREDVLRRLRAAFDDGRLSLAVARLYGPDDRSRLRSSHALSQRTGIPLVAVNDVHYHVPARRPLQDVLTCIRRGCTLDAAGFQLFPNGERCLKSPEEMARLFAEYPQAITRTVEIAERAGGFNLDQLRYEYPDEVCSAGMTPVSPVQKSRSTGTDVAAGASPAVGGQERRCEPTAGEAPAATRLLHRTAMDYLRERTWHGARQRYPEGVPAQVCRELEHEFALIDELNYAPYFLTVYDLVTFARSRGILCQGRGAAANSAVCFCLGVTSVDPARIDILFERFVSRERDEPPDIDIDFEHERREEVIQYLYQKYGRDRAALTAEVITYRGRSAVRDVGKVLGLSLDAVDRLAKRISHWTRNIFETEDNAAPTELSALGFDPQDQTIRQLVSLTRQIIGFPRHLSQHVGGFVITRGPLCELVPIENAAMPNRTVIEWDKDDLEAIGMLKVDILGLGMLTCLRKGFELVEQHQGWKPTLATIPPEDPVVYDLLCRADTVGVFQVESRAQMTMLPRLKPRCFYDLVIEVAIVRPGPIVGDMVHPYLRRRNGVEEPYYPDEKIKAVLAKTLGVPLFQEQAMALAVVAAGFTAGEAELLRRTITAWKSNETVACCAQRFLEGMLRNGYEREFAEQCFNRLKGFSEYGFPESHAASFALLVYASAWLKCYYPAAFAAALLNSQPMGFYAPAQIVHDARDHGIEVRPVDVNHSQWDATLEDAGKTLRLGLRMVNGLRENETRAIVEIVKASGPFASVYDLWRATRAHASTLRTLARADAFGSLGLDRQHALWQVQSLHGNPQPLFDGGSQGSKVSRVRAAERGGEDVTLPPVSEVYNVAQDYHTVGLSLKSHPLSFLRAELRDRRAVTAAEMKDERRSPSGTSVAVAGIVLFRQRPGTAKGVMFMTLEDETGRADLIVRPRIYERFRTAALYGKVVLARGRVERQGLVVHLLAHRIEDIGALFDRLPHLSRDFR